MGCRRLHAHSAEVSILEAVREFLVRYRFGYTRARAHSVCGISPRHPAAYRLYIYNKYTPPHTLFTFFSIFKREKCGSVEI